MKTAAVGTLRSFLISGERDLASLRAFLSWGCRATFSVAITRAAIKEAEKIGLFR